jgi:hypothetical protein
MVNNKSIKGTQQIEIDALVWVLELCIPLLLFGYGSRYVLTSCYRFLW